MEALDQETATVSVESESDLAPIDRAVELYGEYSCSEAILRTFNEAYDLGLPESAYGIATPFGAGMGNSGCLCGAIAGGELVLGLALGRVSSADAPQPAFEASKELHDRFRARYKVACCRGLTHGLERGTPERKAQCQAYIRFAATVTTELLGRERPA